MKTVEKNRAVILVTLDGVRWQEMQKESRNPFRRLWRGWGKEAVLKFGSIANPMVMSLPAYQSIFAGATQRCYTNACARIRVPTLPEGLAATFGPAEVASFASWGPIERALEHRPGSSLVCMGLGNRHRREFDGLFEELDRTVSGDRPRWGHSRWDRHTQQYAERYFDHARPKFLYLGFGDGDSWAHSGRFLRYWQTLVRYDVWLERWVERARAEWSRAGRETLVLVTTDHGRGSGLAWSAHVLNPAGRRVWTWAHGVGDGAKAFLRDHVEPRRTLGHLQIRPLIESWMRGD